MYVSATFLVAIAIFIDCSRSAALEDDVTNFSYEISKLARTRKSSTALEKLIKNLALPENWHADPKISIDEVSPRVTCTTCKAFAKSILELRRNGTTAEAIQDTIINLCIRLHLHTESVCRGSTKLNAPVFFWIIDNDPTVTANDYCALALQNSHCVSAPAKFEWTVEIDRSPPKLLDATPSEEHLKIVHVSDIHYDPLYEPNGNAKCGQPNCCRKGQGPSPAGAPPAGYWGDYRVCDTPWHAVIDALDHINKTHSDAEYIYYTGDIVDHGEWETTREGNIKIIQDVFKKIKTTFKDTPVFPIIGNHEANPLNLFASAKVDDDKVSTKWLYELLADIWINYGWLPESTRSSILQGGFYTLSPRKGFRIIALNNNVAYTYNWWLIYEPKDLGGQLKWLANTLLEAEKNKEFVHILVHVPSGNHDQQNTWSREYRKIINRFSHIIAGQFNGHTHSDEFNIFYEPRNFSNIINIAWNGGSITTWSYVNPNYRTYTVNGKTYDVEDADNWMYNLTEANLTPEKRPNWVKSYSFKEEYGLKDLSKRSISDLVVELSKKGPKSTAYHRHMAKDAKIKGNSWNCDKKCAIKNVCKIVTSVNNNNADCNYIKGLKP
ncbi:sphingomyelin phosphodiesterase [Fopius arisanus]|uniref:Sphingomyelin phosphodiesterase n=3 Tax=Fopius arisanus TaxID=64838 RepID=A0A9R1T641_9HYME|nr:PREDICTED: sphingomyelin phosphodiesterase-like [Fopius arisanus]